MAENISFLNNLTTRSSIEQEQQLADKAESFQLAQLSPLEALQYQGIQEAKNYGRDLEKLSEVARGLIGRATGSDLRTPDEKKRDNAVAATNEIKNAVAQLSQQGGQIDPIALHDIALQTFGKYGLTGPLGRTMQSKEAYLAAQAERAPKQQETFTTLNEEQEQQLGLDPAGQYQISNVTGKVSNIGGGQQQPTPFEKETALARIQQGYQTREANWTNTVNSLRKELREQLPMATPDEVEQEARRLAGPKPQPPAILGMGGQAQPQAQVQAQVQPQVQATQQTSPETEETEKNLSVNEREMIKKGMTPRKDVTPKVDSRTGVAYVPAMAKPRTKWTGHDKRTYDTLTKPNAKFETGMDKLDNAFSNNNRIYNALTTVQRVLPKVWTGPIAGQDIVQFAQAALDFVGENEAAALKQAIAVLKGEGKLQYIREAGGVRVADTGSEQRALFEMFPNAKNDPATLRRLLTEWKKRIKTSTKNYVLMRQRADTLDVPWITEPYGWDNFKEGGSISEEEMVYNNYVDSRVLGDGTIAYKLKTGEWVTPTEGQL